MGKSEIVVVSFLGFATLLGVVAWQATKEHRDAQVRLMNATSDAIAKGVIDPSTAALIATRQINTMDSLGTSRKNPSSGRVQGAIF